METLEIKVPDKQKAHEIIRELEKRGDVSSVRIVPTRSSLSRKKTAPGPPATVENTRSGVDEVTLASEISLAKDWLSPEDDHWDDVYKDLCIKKEI